MFEIEKLIHMNVSERMGYEWFGGEVFWDVFSTVRECCTFDIYFEIFIIVSCFISILVGYWMAETDVQRLFRTLQPSSIAWERAVIENDDRFSTENEWFYNTFMTY